MVDLKTQIKNILLEGHVGRARAIKVRDLSLIVSMPGEAPSCVERKVRKAVRELNMEGFPVVTSVHFPYGVFVAEGIEDTKDYSANLWSRIHHMIDRAKKVDEAGTKKFLKGQLSLF